MSLSNNASRPLPQNGLFIPIEVQKREYIGKMLLAVEMARRGMPVFIGHKSPIIKLALQATEPGILLYKSARGPGTDFFSDLERKGFLITAQDEEAGVIYDTVADFYEARQSLKNTGTLDTFFCWGKDDFEFLSDRQSGQKCVFLPTGSPRTCLWGEHGASFYKERIKQLKDKYGKFILFVCNFGSGNYFLSPNDAIAQLSQYQDYDGEVKAKHLALVERDRKLMALFLEAAERIVSETNFSVVIRPHPSEDVHAWIRLTSDTAKIAIGADGELTPWIIASECVVQNSCTSALEAVSASVPTVAFGATDADLYSGSQTLPNRLSLPVTGIESLLKVLPDIRALWNEGAQQRKEILERRLCGAGTLSPVRAIADGLSALIGEANSHGNEKLGRDSTFHELYEMYRTSRWRIPGTSKTMDQAKRPALFLKTVKDDVSKICYLFGYREQPFVRRVGPGAFCIRTRRSM